LWGNLYLLNFLAHFYLAYGDDDRLVGQFIADAVKGKQYENYSPSIQEAIFQHREIDQLTDQHESTLHLRSIIRPEVGLLSSVAIDVYMDHILALEWNKFHALSLPQFAQNVYGTLKKNHPLLPERMQHTLKYMEMHDWLSGYAEEEGIKRSLNGLSRRVSGGEKLNVAAEMFVDLKPQIETTFHAVFKDLSVMIKRRIEATNQPKLDSNHYY
jgi:acyl carrier protein phosphodiesterase